MNRQTKIKIGNVGIVISLIINVIFGIIFITNDSDYELFKSSFIVIGITASSFLFFSKLRIENKFELEWESQSVGDGI